MMFFTSDTHFGYGSYSILEREMRPYISPKEYMIEQIKIWNDVCTRNDILYVLGDMINYNLQEQDWIQTPDIVKTILPSVVLIIGNNEQRIINSEFSGDFELFREYLISKGFADVKMDDYVSIGGKQFYLNHFPTHHRNDMLNLFGHVHRSTGIWKPYGFNVGTDINHFRPFSEEDILHLLHLKRNRWDISPDVLCMQ